MDIKEGISLPADFKKKRVTFNTALSNNYASKEAYKALRTNIIFTDSEAKIIVITSSQAGEGKSTVSSELAKSFADSNKKTLLLDADMRKSVLLKKNSKSEEIKGLSELLLGKAALSEVIFGTQEDNFDVMFTGKFPENPVELLSGNRLNYIFEELKKHYDYVIVDTPPVGLVIDAAVISAVADSAIIVVSENKTKRKKALEVKNQLKRSGTKILGVIVNETEKQTAGYYGYYRKNDKYYK